MDLKWTLSRNIRRFMEHDKKLLVKVIAGLVLIAAAFAFYLVKEITADRDMAVTVVPESGGGTSLQAGETDAGTGAGDNSRTTSAALEKEIMIMVDVAGAVVNPAVVELPEGSRVFEAVEKAGGLTKDADTGLINRAEILSDGQKIYIPTKQEVKEIQKGQPPAALQYNTGVNKSAGQPKLVNINTADSEVLQQLTGVGPATAGKIIDYRNKNGKFRTIEELKNVSGIGDKTFEKFKDKITI